MSDVLDRAKCSLLFNLFIPWKTIPTSQNEFVLVRNNFLFLQRHRDSLLVRTYVTHILLPLTRIHLTVQLLDMIFRAALCDSLERYCVRALLQRQDISPCFVTSPYTIVAGFDMHEYRLFRSLVLHYSEWNFFDESFCSTHFLRTVLEGCNYCLI